MNERDDVLDVLVRSLRMAERCHDPHLADSIKRTMIRLIFSERERKKETMLTRNAHLFFVHRNMSRTREASTISIYTLDKRTRAVGSPMMLNVSKIAADALGCGYSPHKNAIVYPAEGQESNIFGGPLCELLGFSLYRDRAAFTFEWME